MTEKYRKEESILPWFGFDVESRFFFQGRDKFALTNTQAHIPRHAHTQTLRKAHTHTPSKFIFKG